MTYYSIFPLSLTSKAAFTEASAEELRVLLALIEAEGAVENLDTLSKKASVSKPRCRAALSFWKESDVVFEKESSNTPTITEEFEERIRTNEIREKSSESTALFIRDNSLKDMIEECASIMGLSSLNTQQIKELTALYEQYSLSAEYIVTLAAHISNSKRLTVPILVNKALSLNEKGVDNIKALEDYITEFEGESETIKEFRKIFGIYGRALSKSEKEYFRKWSKDYVYFTDIVGEAYDIACANATRGHARYADKLLTRWFEAGCRTLKDCRECYENDEAERKNATKEKKLNLQNKKPQKQRYGDFDVEDAFMKALERSYKDSD